MSKQAKTSSKKKAVTQKVEVSKSVTPEDNYAGFDICDWIQDPEETKNAYKYIGTSPLEMVRIMKKAGWNAMDVFHVVLHLVTERAINDKKKANNENSRILWNVIQKKGCVMEHNNNPAAITMSRVGSTAFWIHAILVEPEESYASYGRFDGLHPRLHQSQGASLCDEQSFPVFLEFLKKFQEVTTENKPADVRARLLKSAIKVAHVQFKNPIDMETRRKFLDSIDACDRDTKGLFSMCYSRETVLTLKVASFVMPIPTVDEYTLRTREQLTGSAGRPNVSIDESEEESKSEDEEGSFEEEDEDDEDSA